MRGIALPAVRGTAAAAPAPPPPCSMLHGTAWYARSNSWRCAKPVLFCTKRAGIASERRSEPIDPYLGCSCSTCARSERAQRCCNPNVDQMGLVPLLHSCKQRHEAVLPQRRERTDRYDRRDVHSRGAEHESTTRCFAIGYSCKGVFDTIRHTNGRNGPTRMWSTHCQRPAGSE